MSIKNGIILYTIERDGCLNGVYTHEGLQGKIFNEIARKIYAEEEKTIYACAYFETEKQAEARIATLEIVEKPAGIFRFLWLDGKKELFYGDGYRITDHQFAVIYHSGKRPA